MTTIIRVLNGPQLPDIELRDALLRRTFCEDGEELEIHNFHYSAYDPTTLPFDLQKKIFELQAVAVELDTRERHPITMAACGVLIGAIRTIVLYPYFTARDGSPHPVFNLDTRSITIPEDARFTGYCELVDAVPIATPRPDIVP